MTNTIFTIKDAKPCPYCSSKDLIYCDGSVECNKCGAKGPYDEDGSDAENESYAVENWNIPIEAIERAVEKKLREQQQESSKALAIVFAKPLNDDGFYNEDVAHIEADKIMLETLKDCGFSKTASLYEKMARSFYYS